MLERNRLPAPKVGEPFFYDEARFVCVASMHLYLHIPFCQRVCPYCGFYKHTPGSTPIGEFAEALLKEACLRLPSGTKPSTVYFGGGTPAMLSPLRFGRLAEGLAAYFDFSAVKEFSFEANPAAFNLKKARQWRDCGVTRVSLGVQSWEPSLLLLLGRTHSPDQAIRSVEVLREAGIPEVNIDLMYALPTQTLEQWEHTLRKTLEISPEHVSAYNLTLEEGTPFAEWYGTLPHDEETDAVMYEMADSLLAQAGFIHYETSNYALAGKQSQHNLAYWMGEDYIGLGPGAVGTWEGMRYRNCDDTMAYIKALSSDMLPPGETERLNAEDVRTERLGLGLRTDKGVPMSLISSSRRSVIDGLIAEGMAEYLPNGFLHLIGRGRLLADAIAVELL